jgi:hypothetical protein
MLGTKGLKARPNGRPCRYYRCNTWTLSKGKGLERGPVQDYLRADELALLAQLIKAGAEFETLEMDLGYVVIRGWEP